MAASAGGIHISKANKGRKNKHSDLRGTLFVSTDVLILTCQCLLGGQIIVKTQREVETQRKA